MERRGHPSPSERVGLPPSIAGCLFDLDGVLTPTATIHAEAWKRMFDGFLAERADGGSFLPFDTGRDYEEFVDGRPRYDGVRAFLDSRGMRLPDGTPEDPPTAQTVCGLGNRKNELVVELIRRRGVGAYEGSRRYLEAAAGAGLRLAVVSSSANCKDVLRSASIERFFHAVID
ncbi:MAG: HAD family hydrolase, partial [Candidatus Dormibacteria bacterium]